MASTSGRHGRRWVRREPSSVAIRKVLQAARYTRVLDEVVAASAAFALAGIVLYILVYPSGVVLFEAMVWGIEALAFLGVALALRVAASRAAFYRARYEILRVEALVVVALSVAGMTVTLVVVVRSLHPGEPTPAELALYPLAGALASYFLERLVEARLSEAFLSLVSIEAIRGKLRYDVAFEAGGGVGVLAANVFHSHAVEAAAVVVIGAYVFYGLGSMAAEHLLYLIGPGPAWRRRMIRRAIAREAAHMGLRLVKLRVEVYGTFAEAEVWIALRPSVTLREAHRLSRLLAVRLVHRIPELLRVVVVPVPAYKPSGEGRRYERQHASRAVGSKTGARDNDTGRSSGERA